MKEYTFDTTPYFPGYVDALEVALSRMGWLSGRDSDSMSVAIPPEDDWVFQWVAEGIII